MPVINTPISVKEFKSTLLRHLNKTLVSHTSTASEYDWSLSLIHTIRELVLDRFMSTMEEQHESNVKRVYYMSMEYLVGRLTADTMINLGVYDTAAQALQEYGLELDSILEQERDMGLGNGGLGRLAACFLDSMATQEIPSVGYGINYEFGLFRQTFVDGRQVECTDEWRSFGCPWQVIRPEYQVDVHIGGQLERKKNFDGKMVTIWHPDSKVIGVPSDIPVPGYGVDTVNFLRLWAAKASRDFDFQTFDEGGYSEAVREKVESETISKILYPNDNTESGRKLRLLQEYFFVACSLTDILRRHLNFNASLDNLSDKAAVHINDTHPAIAVAELMRLLIDVHDMPWDKAWGITERACAYTNHTLMPEALEKWSVVMFEEMLPRHLDIIRGIDKRFLAKVDDMWPGDKERAKKLGLIDDSGDGMVRMAHLAIVGSHSVNGVAALHSELLKERMFPDMVTLFPGRFNNKTNGITPRRWMRTANPRLSQLIDSAIGPEWTRNLELLRGLEPLANDASFKESFNKVKRFNKLDLTATIKQLCGINVDPDALFDVQIKRLHEYKRQHLNLLHIIALYKTLLDDPNLSIQPRVFIFGAKAAPGYKLAKHIIHAINSVATVINADRRVKDLIKIVFIPNYSVSLAQKIIPAANLSEQISTAGLEASGTGNMKLALNGALTIGTLDGANIEIRDNVGAENIFIFGKTVEEVRALQQNGYSPTDSIKQSPQLQEVLGMIKDGSFFTGNPSPMEPLYETLTQDDPFLVCADFDSYVQAQSEAANAFKNTQEWTRKAVLNVARCGTFSSDRTISQYASEIWGIKTQHTAR